MAFEWGSHGVDKRHRKLLCSAVKIVLARVVCCVVFFLHDNNLALSLRLHQSSSHLEQKTDVEHDSFFFHPPFTNLITSVDTIANRTNRILHTCQLTCRHVTDLVPRAVALVIHHMPPCHSFGRLQDMQTTAMDCGLDGGSFRASPVASNTKCLHSASNLQSSTSIATMVAAAPDEPSRMPDDTGKEDYDFSSWRIALYYIYLDLSAGNQVETQVTLHRELCEQRDLKGRIRISSEGINGVLSGRYEVLQEYERLVTQMLGDLTQSSLDLDLKYCFLREDLPLESQLFDSLMVKKTQTVISLFDSEPPVKSRCRKRQAHKERQLEQSSMKRDPSIPSAMNVARIQQEMMQLAPSRHLTAEEWNEHLLRGERRQSALLLDVRNVYESRVGHFAAPDVPTLLTNTRKYSDLPYLLATNSHIQEKEDIYMYCTGGVRCERVSMLVQSIYPEKRVYQLQGGIQTYLTSQHNQNAVEECSTCEDHRDGSSGIIDPQSPTHLFHGKNFVFDPRRTDPLHGPTAVVGKCLVCLTAHDDYDNGHAPIENKEARCNTCRMLILVCNFCRPKYVCCGERDEESSSSSRPMLYCGLDRCVHEGAAPMAVLLLPQSGSMES